MKTLTLLLLTLSLTSCAELLPDSVTITTLQGSVTVDWGDSSSEVPVPVVTSHLK